MTASGQRQSAAGKLGELASDITFTPSSHQREVKAAFWVRYNENPIYEDMDEMSLAAVQQLAPDPRLSRWWSVPLFREWFLNKDEFRQRAEYLAHRALDCLEEVMSDPEANANAKVNASKAMIEVANRFPSRGQKSVPMLDADIANMTEAQLLELLRRAAPLLTAGGESSGK